MPACRWGPKSYVVLGNSDASFFRSDRSKMGARLLTSTTLGTLTHMALRLADRTLSLRICLPALTLAVLLSFAFLTACNWKEADVSSSECEEEMSEMKVNDTPQDRLPVLNSKALSELKGTPEGMSGGLMSHQWEVSGQVVACDEESGAVAVSVDSDNDYAQYLNSPILVSAGKDRKSVV